MPTYEITDQTTHSNITLFEGVDAVKFWALPKTITYEVSGGYLEIYLGKKLILPKIPRAFISVPTSTDDEDLFTQLAFMSSANVGGGAAADVTYDNTASGLAATNVQAAIDKIAGNAFNFIYPKASIQVFNYDFAGSNAVLTTNELKGAFVTIFKDIEIDRLYAYPVIALAGASVWGLYELDQSSGYPTNLLFQGNPIDNGIAANQFTAFGPAKKIRAGVYLAAGITNSAATFQVHNGASPVFHGHGVLVSNLNNYIQGYRVAQAYSPTLPPVFPAGATLFTNEFVIKLGFRIAA